MRSSKGISMISLIVTIICMILLASIAIGTGSRYIRESKNKDKSAFISVMSSAVKRRNSDTLLNSLAYPYLGYYIDQVEIFENNIAPKIPEPLEYETGIWYVVDTGAARRLGVKEPERYIETISESYTDEVKVALVDYSTGKVFLIEAYSSELGDTVEIGKEIVGHTHSGDMNYPTCTEPRKCIQCGCILKEALGHTYAENQEAIPASGDEANAHYNKTCIVCGMQGGYEPHEFRYLHAIVDGKWYHSSYCTICNYGNRTPEERTDMQVRCTEVIVISSNASESVINHTRSCRVCGHLVVEPHEVAYRRISASMHEKYCENQLCAHVILREPHVDVDSNSMCDLCGSEIISTAEPQLLTVEISCKSGDEEKAIAKYGDTILMKIVADKPLNRQKFDIIIGERNVPITAITSTNNITWDVSFTLNSGGTPIPNGQLMFSIHAESTAGIPMSSRITSTTNASKVMFDGMPPAIEYIDKNNRVD